MARVDPKPWVIIGDNHIPTCSDTYASRVTVLDDVTIQWGQDHPTDDRKATKAIVRLYDPAGEMMRRLAAEDLAGTMVVIGWSLGPAEADEYVMFRGRVAGADVDLSRRSAVSPVGRGFSVTITCTDPSADLAEYKVPDQTVWPAETSIVRANRVLTVCRDAGVRFDAVYFAPSVTSYPMGQLDVSKKSALELLNNFYRSFGTTWTYRPQNNVTRPVEIRNSFGAQQWVWRIPGTQEHILSGWYTNSSGFGDDSEDYYDTTLFACELEPTDAATVDRRDAFTFIDLTYRRANGSEWKTGLIADDSAYVRRTLTWETWLNLDSPNQGNVTPLWANLLWQRYVTLWPQHPALRWAVPAAGFYGRRQAEIMTRCAHSISVCHINGDPWAAAMPEVMTDSPHGLIAQWSDYQIIGGTVRYTRGRWVIDLTPAWLGWSTFGNTGELLMPWQELAADVPAGAFTWHGARRWHDSMTWSDMRRTYTGAQADPSPEIQ